jgi:hypothetical protein
MFFIFESVTVSGKVLAIAKSMRHQSDKKVKQCCQPQYDTMNPDNITAIPGIRTKDKDVY